MENREEVGNIEGCFSEGIVVLRHEEIVKWYHSQYKARPAFQLDKCYIIFTQNTTRLITLMSIVWKKDFTCNPYLISKKYFSMKRISKELFLFNERMSKQLFLTPEFYLVTENLRLKGFWGSRAYNGL